MEVAKLNKKRGVVKSQLTRFENFMEKYDDTMKGQARLKIKAVEGLLKEYIELQVELELVDEGNAKKYEQETADFENKYTEALASAHEKVYKTTGTDTGDGGTGAGTARVETRVRLPELQLLKYGGKLDDYNAFIDNFSSIVDSNTSLSPSQKLYYLKAQLYGPALSAIQAIENTDANYATALAIIKERFENRKLAIDSALRNLFEIKALSREEAKALRYLNDTLSKTMGTMKALNVNTTEWDVIINFVIAEKLDATTKREWAQRQERDKTATIAELQKFIADKCTMLETVGAKATTPTATNAPVYNRTKTSGYAATLSDQRPCFVCRKAHSIHNCPSFQEKTPTERMQLIQQLRLCINCFQDHPVARCNARGRCQKCNGRHGTAVHVPRAMPPRSRPGTLHRPTTADPTDRCLQPTAADPVSTATYGLAPAEGAATTNALTATEIAVSGNKTVLLSTVKCYVKGKNGMIACRGLLDSGSEANFMTQELHDKLQLETMSTNMQVCGIGGAQDSVNGKVTAEISATDGRYAREAEYLIMPTLSNIIPRRTVNIQNISIPFNIKLADPRFYEPAPIDIIIGAEIFWEILEGKTIALGYGKPKLRKTKMGFIVTGACDERTRDNENSRINVNFVMLSRKEVDEGTISAAECATANCINNKRSKDGNDNDGGDDDVSNEIVCEKLTGSVAERDKISVSNALIAVEQKKDENDENEDDDGGESLDEIICEKLFAETTERGSDGKFIVRIPFNEKLAEIGESKEAAKRRFYSLEKRLMNNPQIKAEYVKFMRDYIARGHMRPCERSESGGGGGVDGAGEKAIAFYLPHIATAKAKTGKHRTVFCANAKSSTGISLNDAQFKGPVVQDKLFAILVNFRKHVVAINADCEKMYRMVWVAKDQWRYQRILWRENPEDELRIYELRTVTYGMRSSSFLATRCLKEIAAQSAEKYPTASESIKTNFYVDDYLAGARTVDEAEKLKEEVSEILKGYGFNLRKWRSNSARLCQTPEEKEFAEDGEESTLGVGCWKPDQDVLKFSIAFADDHEEEAVTKRKLLSELGSIFDPLQILAPVTVSGKLLMQRLWKAGTDWDEPVANEIREEWQEFKRSLKHMNNICVPRCITLENPIRIEIHGYSDASQKIIAACVYLRVISESGEAKAELIAAKVKIASSKNKTTPRLELTAAALLVELMTATQQALKIENCREHFWTDSMIVLHWIKNGPQKMTQFIKNRIEKIRRGSRVNDWRHVASENNPADIPTRGIKASELGKCEKWFRGPPELSNGAEEFPEFKMIAEKSICTVVEVRESTRAPEFINKFSDLAKLCRVTAYVKRFINNCTKGKQNIKGPLTSNEYEEAMQYLIKTVQREIYAEEIRDLEKNKPVKMQSSIKSLDPFLDEEQILRVGGRIQAAGINYDAKHQIILPKKCHLTKLIIRSEHVKNMHASQRLLLYATRQRYWPVGGASECKKIVKQCVLCFKSRPTFQNPKMGNLPAERISPTPAFYETGCDFAGPFQIKTGSYRNAKTDKAYLCIFVCFASRALHIETVSRLSTEAFVAALKRFVARRGIPKCMHTDNATNFKGAKNELREFYKFIEKHEKDEEMQRYFLENKIEWKFIPARSSWRGGLWERSVRSVKEMLSKITKNVSFTFEELATYTAQIEQILNSRPLTSCSNDINDLNPLSPAHLLIGRPLNAFPEKLCLDKKLTNLSRFKMIDHLTQQFWLRWQREYLTELQQRNKWRADSKTPFSIGDLVVIKEENMPTATWKTGRVEKTLPGKDGVVRTVVLRTQHGSTIRAVNKLAVIPLDDDGPQVPPVVSE